MHILESYSLQAGQHITNIDIKEKVYPLPFNNKYIVFSPFSKPSKNYDYWDEVIFFIQPILEKNGISIVQVGGNGEKAFNGCLHTQGTTAINHVAYLIKNSEMLLSVDTFTTHIAGNYNKKIVALYSNNFLNNVCPYFGDKNNQILLEPDRSKLKPSFALEEQNKQINTIQPEQVINAVFKLLNLPEEHKYVSVSFGESYINKMIETVPNHVVNNGSLGVESLIVRMDFEFNEDILAKQMQVCPVSIVTNKSINLNLLKTFRPRIKQLIYVIDKNFDIKWIKELYTSGVNYVFISYESEEWLNTIKLDFLDYGMIIKKNIKRVDNVTNLCYRSSKITLSNGKIYPSYDAYLKNLPIKTIQSPVLDVSDNDNFWKEEEHFYLLKT